MMLPTYADLTARQEQHQDRLRRAERRHLFRTAGLAPAGNPDRRYRTAINWLGSQMVRLGATLQQYGVDQPTHVTSTQTSLSRQL
jgi:hypothetical protein